MPQVTKILALCVILLAVVPAANAAYPVPVSKTTWIAAKNTWTRAAVAHGVPAAAISCKAWSRLEAPACDLGAAGQVMLNPTSTRCKVEAWAVKPPSAPGFKRVSVTVNPCRAGWTRTLPMPWA